VRLLTMRVMRLISPFLCLLLIPLVAALPVSAQLPAPAAPLQDLQLKVVENDSAQVPVHSASAKGVTVQVTDITGAGVPDVAVALRLPDNGPTGTFSDGMHAAVIYTDQSGRAHAGGIHWGDTPGVAALRITAAKGAAHAGILVEQTLTAAASAKPAVLAAPSVSVPATQSAPSSAAPAAGTLPSAPSAPGSKTAIPGQRATLVASAPAPSAAPSEAPAVSVTNGSPAYHAHSGKAKWIIIAAIAIGAGAGVAMMAGKSKSSNSSSSSTGPSIGSPSISIGHP
jgi:hypothetical protein